MGGSVGATNRFGFISSAINKMNKFAFFFALQPGLLDLLIFYLKNWKVTICVFALKLDLGFLALLSSAII